jgi:hypothetical protein
VHVETASTSRRIEPFMKPLCHFLYHLRVSISNVFSFSLILVIVEFRISIRVNDKPVLISSYGLPFA